MFVQNFIKLSAAVNELSCVQRKNSAENNTVRRYRADSNYCILGLSLQACWALGEPASSCND